MKKIAPIAGGLLAVLSIAFLVRNFRRSLGSLPPINWSPGSLFAAGAGVGILLICFFLLAAGWRILLGGGKIKISVLQAVEIMGRAQIAKYLPGNFFHYVGRTALGMSKSLPPETVLLTMGVETLAIISTSLMIIVMGFLIGAGPREIDFGVFPPTHHAGLWIGGFALACALVIVASPRAREWARTRAPYLHPRIVLPAMLAYSLLLFLNGPVIALIAREIWNIYPPVSWYDFSFGYTTAWLAGFLVPGAPAGIGIREAVFVSFFSTPLGEGPAIGVALTLRVLSLVADVITFVVASFLKESEGSPRI